MFHDRFPRLLQVPGKERITGFEANVEELLPAEEGMRGHGNDNEIGGDAEFLEIRAGFVGVCARVVEFASHEYQRWVGLVQMMAGRGERIDFRSL